MDLTDSSILHHVLIVLALLWILSFYGCCYPIFYILSFIYIFLVNERYSLKLQKRLHFKEKKQANQKRLLSDVETVRWLNHAVKKVWPICMEQIASQEILLPIIPWFLEKYKPWTVSKAVVQQLYLGRNPPVFTEARIVHQSADDDHLVLELGMSFLSADDMDAILAAKLKKRLGFGMWAKMHITSMHVEGKVLVGIKFLDHWPFLGLLRICFAEPPYFQMTVKPIFNHGIDVTEIPGIAGWLDKILAVAFEQTLVEPNVLAVDVEKLTSSTEPWFSINEKCPLAYANVEVVEATDIKSSDFNGLADPYVKGQIGPYRFRTKIRKKTVSPKWREEFKIPISTWESPNELVLEVRDKDRFVDDILGKCSINVTDLRDGQRHDVWLPLQNSSTGRLHLAVILIDLSTKEDEKVEEDELSDENVSTEENDSEIKTSETTEQEPPQMADEFESINIEGQQPAGLWVHHPGSEISQTWEPRKMSIRRSETQIYRVDNSMGSPGSGALRFNDNGSSSSDDENPEGKRLHPISTIRKRLKKIGSVFNKNHNNKDETVSIPGTVMDNNSPGLCKDLNMDNESSSRSELDKQGKGHMRGMAKSILKHAGKGAHDIKHAVVQKSSNKCKEHPGSDAEYEDQAHDYSDNEFLLSSKDHAHGVGERMTDSTSLSKDSVRHDNGMDRDSSFGESLAKGEPLQSKDMGNDDMLVRHRKSLPCVVGFQDNNSTAGKSEAEGVSLSREKAV